jgi:hypothetical protein
VHRSPGGCVPPGGLTSPPSDPRSSLLGQSERARWCSGLVCREDLKGRRRPSPAPGDRLGSAACGLHSQERCRRRRVRAAVAGPIDTRERSVMLPVRTTPSAQSSAGSEATCQRARPAVEPRTSTCTSVTMLATSRGRGGGVSIVRTSRSASTASRRFRSRTGSSGQRFTGCRRSRWTNRETAASPPVDEPRTEATA